MAIPTRIEMGTTVAISASHYSGGNTSYIVETPTGVLYRFYREVNSEDMVFDKSTDYGLNFTAPTALKAMTCVAWAVWYDRWTDPTGVLGDLIHVVYLDSGADDLYYRTINTASSDSLGTERTIFAGAHTAAGGALSVSRMRGGNIIVAGSIDAGTEVFALKSADYFATAGTAIANPYEASPDKLIMLPGWGADNQDAMCFYYDNSGTEVSVKYYDDSGDSWAETSIATSITHPDHTSTTLGHWAATVDHTNSQNLLAFWTAVDASNADLRVFKVTQAAQTETATNCVLNSTEDQGFCGISIFGASWYVFYCGSSDGAETYNSLMYTYYKVSTDAGVNWSSETRLSRVNSASYVLTYCPIIYKTFAVMHYITTGTILINTKLAIPHTTFNLGM